MASVRLPLGAFASATAMVYPRRTRRNCASSTGKTAFASIFSSASSSSKNNASAAAPLRSAASGDPGLSGPRFGTSAERGEVFTPSACRDDDDGDGDGDGDVAANSKSVPEKGSRFVFSTTRSAARTRSGTRACALSQVMGGSGASRLPSAVAATHVMKYDVRATAPRKEGGKPGGRRTRTSRSTTRPGCTTTSSATAPAALLAMYRSPGFRPVPAFGALADATAGLTHVGSSRSTPCHETSMARTRTGPPSERARTRTEKSSPGVTASTSRSAHSRIRGETRA